LVTNLVEHEIVFGLENMGMTPGRMRQTLAEVSALLHCTHLLARRPYELSGGEQQRVAVAAAVAMARQALILDEPTSQLDPLAAAALFQVLQKLHQELGLTIVLVEQHLDLCFGMAERVILMEKGRVVAGGKPRDFARAVGGQEQRSVFLPPVTRLFAESGYEQLPLTVVEGRRILAELPLGEASCKRKFPEKKRPASLQLDQVYYSYAEGKCALRGVSLLAYPGELLCVLGENGAGKSTLLKAILQACRPQRGGIYWKGRRMEKLTEAERRQIVGYLSQNPNDHLVNETVEGELRFTLEQQGCRESARVDAVLRELGLEALRARNPRQLSAGERQRVALASVLVAEPELLLVDEPTRGLDPLAKKQLGRSIQGYQKAGRTVVLITQDMDFAAEFADQVLLLFRGEVVACGTPEETLCGGLFYVSSMSKLWGKRLEGLRTLEDARYYLRGDRCNPPC
jgi:energy-coupling factor transport system ATP-binding protein